MEPPCVVSCLIGKSGRLPHVAQSVLHPNLREPLPLAVVVAEDVNGVALPQPAVKLIKKFAPLHPGNLWIGHTFPERTIRVERTENWSAGFRPGALVVRAGGSRRVGDRRPCCRVWISAFRRLGPAKAGTPNLVHFIQLQLRHPTRRNFAAKLFPRDEKWIAGWNLLRVFIGAHGELLRIAEQKNGFTREVIEQS